MSQRPTGQKNGSRQESHSRQESRPQRKARLQRLTLCGLLAAAAVIVLLLASIAPGGWLGLTALAGLCTAIACCTAGLGGGCAVWLVGSLLALLLLPRKEIALLFALLFGPYPVLKALLERKRMSRPVELFLKLAAANALLALSWLVLGKTLLDGVSLPLAALWLGANIVFLCYDWTFSGVITLLQQRLRTFSNSH